MFWMSFGCACKMHDVGLWVAFSSCHWQLSFWVYYKPLYSNWLLISIGPQVVCKVFHGKNLVRERSLHLMQKNMLITSEEFTFSTHGY